LSIRKKYLRRVLPFIALETDIEAAKRYGEDLQEFKKPMKQFAMIKHMTMFGRPLLYTDRSYNGLCEFALPKLQGRLADFNI